jgi:hypothetical protein
MNMSLETMLSALTPNEKLAAMDILWRDLSATPTQVASPEWHGDLLANRVENPSPEPSMEIDAALDDVRGRLDARRAKDGS